MRKLIKRLLYEIKFSQERTDELKNKFGWRFVQTQRPKSGNLYDKLHIYTFKSPKYKYNVYIEYMTPETAEEINSLLGRARKLEAEAKELRRQAKEITS